MAPLSYRGYRRRSTQSLFGLPLFDIALGPDPDTGQDRGHARGILAIGDTARGGIAIGGVACGGIAIGGVACGGIACGGLALGLAAMGGLAIGGIAVGGAAVGLVAIGGGAFGYYALGGGAAGAKLISATQQDPEAIQFFQQWMPAGLREWLHLGHLRIPPAAP